MKIELKKIQYSERMSEETKSFVADLYINGIKAGETQNHGHGGPTDYRGYNPKGNELIRQAEGFCEKLPPQTWESHGETHSLPMSLEVYIDNLLENYLQERELQKFNIKMNKFMQKGVVFGIPGRSFGAITYKITLDELLVQPNGPDKLKAMITKDIIPELKGEVIILNTNIPEQLLKETGLKPDQYIAPAIESKQGINPKSSKKAGKDI